MLKKYLGIIREQKRQKHVLRFLVSRILWRTRLCSLLDIPMENYTLKFNPTALSATLWINPRDRSSEEEFFRRYLREKDCVVDVGANIGDLALTAASVIGPEGKVYSLEAHPRTYRYLRKNLALNKFSNIISFNLALGDKESTIIFSNLRSDDMNHVSEDGRGIPIRMARLDDVPIPESAIQLLKIDVEGYEKFVLDGAPKTLDRASCVYIESCDYFYSRYGYACGDVVKVLVEKGFQVFKLVRNEFMLPVQEDYSSTIAENLVAIRALEEFLERTHFKLAR